MKIIKSLAALPLTALVALEPNVQAQSLGGIETEQNQQQRRDAQQRECAASVAGAGACWTVCPITSNG
jgi:hemolysin activation/secretion protein